MKKSDESIVTVKIDANFKATSTEEGYGVQGKGDKYHDHGVHKAIRQIQYHQ